MKLFLINEKALNKLDSINIEQKLGIDTKAKYAEKRKNLKKKFKIFLFNQCLMSRLDKCPLNTFNAFMKKNIRFLCKLIVFIKISF